MYWYEMEGALDGFENDPDYLEKVTEYDEKTIGNFNNKKPVKTRNCAWIRNRSYKKKIVRRFLSMNPAMDYSTMKGICHIHNGIYLNYACYNHDDSSFYDPHVNYCLNPYSRIYLTHRGNLRMMHGDLFRIRTSFALGYTKKVAIKCMNRRLRKTEFTEGIPSYSFCKKYYCPMIDEIW